MNISTPDAVSISLSVFCIVISLIILFSGLFDQGRGLKISRIFRFFIFSNIGFMLSDIIMRLLEGGAEWYVFYVLWVFALVHYISGPLILASMTLYMLAYISIRVKVARFIQFAVYSICGLSILLTIVSQFNNMYYFFDEYNVYHRGPLFLLSQIVPLTGLAANMAIIVYYRHAMQRKVQYFFLAYMVFPIAAMSVHAITFGITLTSIGTTLTALVFYVSVQMELVSNLESKIKISGQQLILQGEFYKMLRSQIDETKTAKHDLRHHLTVIQSFIDEGDKERIEAYLNEHVRTLPANDEIMYCRNFAVNSMLRYYADMAKNEGIKVDARLDLAENVGVSDSDLCIIFGNCMENAIEACRRLSVFSPSAKTEGGGPASSGNTCEDKFIKLSAKPIGKMLAITIDNSFDGCLKRAGDVFMSLKRKGEGIGTSSVKAVAKKYSGSAQFKAEDNVFQVSILLRVA